MTFPAALSFFHLPSKVKIPYYSVSVGSGEVAQQLRACTALNTFLVH